MNEHRAFDKSQNTGFKHLINAFRFSIDGFTAAIRLESSFRQELAVMILLIPAGIWIAETPRDFSLLVAALLLVLIVELLNSGIEASIDRAGEEFHEMSKLAKDYGSAAVMLSLILGGIIWGEMLLVKLGWL